MKNPYDAYEKEKARFLKMLSDLDDCESIVLECKKEFEEIIDAALDGYNDKEISKAEMKNMVRISKRQTEESKQSLEDIQEIRATIRKKLDDL
jgi:hypothetical protein